MNEEQIERLIKAIETLTGVTSTGVDHLGDVANILEEIEAKLARK